MNTEDNKGLNNLLEYINSVRGIDFSLYRHSTIQRKMGLRLEETSSQNYEEYLGYLKSNPGEFDNLITALTIKFSNFFRDPLVYEILYSDVLPELMSKFKFLKVWSIGCAKGEEAYSVAIIVNDLLKKEKGLFNVKVLGTDIDPEALEIAVKGEYQENELSEVKKKYMDAFFNKIPKSQKNYAQADTYRISDEIKSMVQFECSDLTGLLKLQETLPDAYNLILCRNVLIYMNLDLQKEIFNSLNNILYENGYLVLGETETMQKTLINSFDQPCPCGKIYKKRMIS
jgi:chemotaxis methyl-accepting protein methylase